VSELAKALVAFHKEAPHIAMDSENPHFRSRFASLAGIMETVRPVLAKHGLAVVQEPCALESGMPALRTTLMHISGESTSSVMPLAVEKPGPQAQGSALTYARRYSLLAVLGLVADPDDDGNASEGEPSSASQGVSGPNGNPHALTFGKHRGKTLTEILALDKSYLVWLAGEKFVPKDAEQETVKVQASELLAVGVQEYDEDIPF
jgi:ERF superfamily/Exodeoxyribonuclease X-like C-terminal